MMTSGLASVGQALMHEVSSMHLLAKYGYKCDPRFSFFLFWPNKFSVKNIPPGLAVSRLKSSVLFS